MQLIESDEELLHKHRALILAATGDGVYGLDVEGRTTFVNPAAERLTGYSSEEMLGIGQHDLIHHSHPDGTHYPKHQCPIYTAFKDGKVHRDSNEVFWRKDGSCFPVEYISTPILVDGAIVGAVVSFRDITERKQAEKALLESEKRYRKIFNATHDAIFLLRVDDGAILDANEEACRMLGYPHDVLTAMNSAEIHPQEMEEFEFFRKMVLKRGKWRSDKLTCLTGDGERIPARLSASVIRLQECDCILVLAQDMREHYKAEKRARKLRGDLHHVSRLSAMGEMASGMAHELNQPLTAVMNYLQACQLILDTGNEEQRGKISEYMGKAMDQAERAGKIISGLRGFVQKSDARRTIEDLNEIVAEASMLTRSGGVAEDIDFRIDLAENLVPICVDKIQIQQVVFNLVRNGAEALAETKGGRLEVLTCAQSDGSVMVYGLKNCDNCRKALKFLRETGLRPELHDVRAVPLTSDEIERFTTWFGAELVNRKSKTWRDLSDIEREKSASTLLKQYPALMKRPLITAVSEQTLGWGAGVQAIWSATRA